MIANVFAERAANFIRNSFRQRFGRKASWLGDDNVVRQVSLLTIVGNVLWNLGRFTAAGKTFHHGDPVRIDGANDLILEVIYRQLGPFLAFAKFHRLRDGFAPMKTVGHLLSLLDKSQKSQK